MAASQVQPTIWQQMIQQSFLSLYQLPENKITDPEFFQGYDVVFEFSEATIYLLVSDVAKPVSRHDIDASQIREWRKDVVNQLIKHHTQLYLKNNKPVLNNNAAIAEKAIYFIGLTALSVKHQNDQQELSSHTVEYEYGSQFFAEDCVLDLDDEQRVLQIFSYQTFTEIVKQLISPSDLAVFLQFHRRKLAGFQSFNDESTLLQQCFESPDFHQRAIKVQQQLVDAKLLGAIESRLLNASAPQALDANKDLMATIHKNSQMWYTLFSSLVQRYYEAGRPLPKAQVQTLVDESMYTYTCLIEKILAYKNMDKESRWNGYLRHQHSYSVFGRHYTMVFYAQNADSALSATNVRAAQQDLLFDLNAQLQQPVMEDIFLIGVEFRPSESSVNTEVYLDAFHQNGSVLNAEVQRLHKQLAELKAQP